jgi:hypothetical protein
VLTLSHIGLVDQAWQDMSVLQVEVVVRSKHVGWHHGRELTAMLGVVSSAHNKKATILFNCINVQYNYISSKKPVKKKNK